MAGIDASQDSQAYGLAERAFRDYTEGDALYRLAEKVTGADSKITQKLSDKHGKGNVSNMRLGALKQTTKEDVVDQYRNRETLSESDIQAKLESRGIDSTKAAEFASLVARVSKREKLSERDQETLNNNAVVKDVADEILSNQANKSFSTLAQLAKIDSLGRETAKETPDTYSVSDAEGKTLIKDSGAEVTIEDIASIDNGKMMLKVNDGTETKEVNAENISFATNEEAVMYEMVARMDIDTASAKAIIGNFDAKSGMTAGQYINGAYEAFRYGKYNFAPEEMSKVGFSADLTEQQKTFAYNLGKNVHITNVDAQESAVKKAIEGAKTDNKTKNDKKGRVRYESTVSALTDRQKASVRSLDIIAKALGVDIYLYESKLDDKGRRAYTNEKGERITANGWYDPKTGDIHIDINAGQNGEGVMLFTAAHELTHFVRQWSPAKFKVLADFLMAEYGKKGVPVAELVRAQMDLARKQDRKISYDTAYEEMIADSMQTMLSDGAVVEKLAKLANKDKTLVEKMKEKLDELVKAIKREYAGMTPYAKEGRYGAMVDEAERLQELFYDALVSAGENYRGAGGKIMLRDVVEETADLIAIHNISPTLLIEALNRRSLVMPSLAITNKGLTAFGEISLLFNKDTIDPNLNADNKLFGSDAWTPQQNPLKKNAKFDTDKTIKTVNNIKTRIGTKYVQDLFDVTTKQFMNATISADGSIFDAYAHNIGIQTAYAKEHGIISKIPTQADGTVDKTALQAQLNSKLDADREWGKYRRWLNSISDTIITSYDNASNTDILNNMKAQPDTAKPFKLTENGELVVPAVEYSSIDDMRKNKNRLSTDAETATKAVAQKFLSLSQQIAQESNISTKDVVNAINSAYAQRYDTKGIINSFKAKGIEISNAEAKKMQGLYKETVELPTQYFEAKPKRIVEINEIAAAIIPNNTSAELKQMLADNNIRYIEYANGDDASRLESLNSFDEVKFSERNSAEEQMAKELGDDLGAVERIPNGDIALITNKDKSLVLYSARTYEEGGREKLEATLKANGHTQEEINDTLKLVDDAADYLRILAAGYAKQNYGKFGERLSEHLEATVTTDLKGHKQVLSTLVNNGDYPVNLDLALICKKRVAYMRLMNRLIEDGVFGDVVYGGDAIAEVNAILREDGFETACLGCFVESRRLQFQTWAESIVQEWNEAVDAHTKNAGYFGFAKGGKGNLTEADMDAMEAELKGQKKNDKGNVNLGQGSAVTRMNRLLDKMPSLAKKLTVDDLLTPQGLTTLRQADGNLFSIVKSRYGAASPKIVQEFSPYASEIANLTFSYVKKMTGESISGGQGYIRDAQKELAAEKPVKEKGETNEAFKKREAEWKEKAATLAMNKYLFSIGGARIQSFSDFMIENVFDYFQIIADLAAKNSPLHGYTKEIVCLRLFGMTGAKWNGSLIAHVDRSMGKEFAGLLPASEAKNGNAILVHTPKGDYAIGFDDYARHMATNKKSFIQSIGMKDIVALMLDPRYSANVGNITIGVSDMQILGMLDSPLFRMVIPYHASGMLPQFAQLVGVDFYNDYTNYQSTTVKQYFDLEGNPISELKNAKGDTLKPDMSYKYNEEVQKLSKKGVKDAPRQAANNYIEWCGKMHPVYDGKKRVGYATLNPKFSDSPTHVDFSKHKNYYKLLEDFNMYDNNTESVAMQEAVKMVLPSEANRLNAEQMEAYKQALRDTGIFTEADITKYAKKADMTFEEIIKAEMDNRQAYEEETDPKWDTTVKKVEDHLKKHHPRNGQAKSADDYKNAKGDGTISKIKAVDGSYAFQLAPNEIKRSERDYSYEALTSKPDMKITTVGGTVPNNRADVVVMAKKNAASVGKFHKDGSVSVYVDDIGTEVILATKGLRHGLRRTQDAQNETNYIVTLKAGEILKNSIRINELNPSKENASGSYVLIGTAQNKNGDLYIVQSVINQFNNELDSMDVLYAINAKKELAALNAPRLAAKPLSVTNSTISIAELLDYVNKYFPDVLPESVLRHYQHDRRPEGELGEDALFSERNLAPTFYSKMGKVVEGVKQEKLGASSVIPMLTGKGVKAEEIRWSGIHTFLDGKKSVTKQELLDFINGSMLEIGEQMSSNDIDLRYEGGSNRTYRLYDGSGNVVNTFTYNEFIGRYVSENDDEIYTDANELEDAIREEYGSMSSPRWSDYKLDGGSNYREIVFTLPNSSYSNQMMRVHWGEEAEGVIAHARIQDFDINGKKMLFIEEIQSDWHNEGQKVGYEDNNLNKYIEERDSYISKKLADLYGEKTWDDLNSSYGSEIMGEKKYKLALASMEEIYAEWKKTNPKKANIIDTEGGVPDAPFKDNYHEFVLKRLLRMAAEQGYDSIGWTPANIQSDRWSDEFAEGYRIEYDQDIPKFLRKYGRQWGATVSRTTLNNKSNRSTYIDNDGKQYQSIREWYDSVMDSYFGKDNHIWSEYLKGRTRVTQTDDTMNIQLTQTGETLNEKLNIVTEPDTVWSMDITDSMRDSVLYEGQALYSERDPNATSNRSLLANALENAATNDIEKNKLQQYKEKIDFINAEERKLADLNRQLKELRFSKGKRDTIKTKQINDLQAEATKTANRISIYDKQLLNLESTTALKNVLEREKAKARKLQKQRDAEFLQEQKDKANATIREIMNRHTESRKRATEGRHKTVVRNKIKRVIKDLNSVFNKGTKERNVKIGLRDTVRKALEASEVLFSDEITNEDIVRLGVGSVSEQDSEKLERYATLLALRETKTDAVEISRINSQISRLNSDLKDVFIRERARLNRENVSSALDSLAEAYASLQNSDDDYIKNNAFVQGMHDRIKTLSENLNGVIIKDMSLEQLEDVYKIYSSVRHMIVNANSIFRDGLREDLSKKIMTVQGEILELQKDNRKDPRVIVDAIGNAIKSFDWNNQKPVYAFEKLGSKAFQELFWDAVKAEGVYAQDAKEAGDFLDAQKDKFKYADWDFKKAKTFKSANGLDFKLTLSDMMSIYAYSKRPQAFDHMTQGGFTFDRGSEYVDEKGRKRKHVRLTETYTVSIELINEIVKTLSEEQIGYVDAVQAYLTSLGEKGNEISRTLYGIDLFTEQVYFPLKSDADYRSSVEQALNETQTQVSLKNTGMTKQTVPHANNPIVLQGFDDVVLGHVDNMSKYHSFVLPIENLRRVFDNVSRDENASYDATKVIIESVFGESAKQYFDQYITDLNGGVHIGGYQNIFMDMFSKMKKTAVSASLSVVVQQPFAITRAMDMINPVYFAPVNFEAAKRNTDAKSQWEELKKYAPVAIIKEMGGFDVGSSRTTRDYIGGANYKGFGGRIKGFFKDSDYRSKSLDNFFMWGASKADEIGWSTIWKAVKREVASQHKELAVGSEAFLEKCGERFTEVIVYTQVYDSVNSRSGMMRSKRDLDKFATSFMGEPTTTINMVENRMLQLARAVKTKDGKAIAKATAKMGRTVGVTLGSILLTSLAKSLVYAGRDDDEEDKALLERWAKSFGDSLTNDLNPLTMIPYLRDFVSIWEGWDVERPDMTVVADIVTSIKKAIDEGCDLEEALALIGNAGNAFGLPVKNIIREVQGAINVFNDITDNIEPTDIGGAFKEGWTGEEKSTKDSLYQALVSGDESRVAVLRGEYKTEDAYEQAIRKGLRENDPRIREAAQARVDGNISEYSSIVREIKAEGHFSQDTIVAAVNAEINLINKEAKEQNSGGNDEIEDTEEKATSIYKTSDINAAFDNGDTDTALEIIEDLVDTKVSNGMTEKEARSSVKSSITSYWKPLFLEAYNNKDSAEQQRIRRILIASGLYGRTSEVIDTTQQWIKDSKKKK
ncbi:MAG: hypothetical protein II304_05215 [Bacteroidales bacterium]|nr:hypothetical protein [Bacteroidales bacterium]